VQVKNLFVMKFLHITTWLGPPFDGGRINRVHFLRHLTLNDQHYFIVLRSSGDPKEINCAALGVLGISSVNVRIIERPSIRLWDRLIGLAFSSVPPGVAHLERYVGIPLRHTISEIAAQWRPDTVVTWSPNLASSALSDCIPRHVLYACDSFSLINYSISVTSKSRIRQFYNRLIARRYYQYERKYFPKFDKVIFITERDAVSAGQIPSLRNVSVVPNGVDCNQFRPSVDLCNDHDIVSFHGNFAYLPNIDALEVIIQLICPSLQKLLSKSFSLHIIGGSVPNEVISKASLYPWVSMRGYIDDLPRALAASSVYLAPLRMGGGMKNKVLEAMACGLPVLGTPEAFCGLKIRDGIECVVSGIDEMASKLVQLLDNESKLLSIGKAARKWVEKNADWEVCTQKLSAAIRGEDK